MSTQAPPPTPGSAPAQKKDLSPWAWVAIGCGCLVLLTFVVFVALGTFVFKKGQEMVEEATGSESVSEFLDDLQEDPAKVTAETIIRVNPELDLISTDDEAGTITFRNNRTGEEATLNFEDIAEGRFSVTTEEGEFSVDAAAGGSGSGGVTIKGPEGEARFGAATDLSDLPSWVPTYPDAEESHSTMHSVGADGVTGAFISQTSDSAEEVVGYFKRLFADQGWEVGSESMTRTGEGVLGAVTGEMGDRTLNVVVVESEGKSQVTINYNDTAP